MNKDNLNDDHMGRRITDFLSARYDLSHCWVNSWQIDSMPQITVLLWGQEESQTQSSEIELNAKVGGKKIMPF